MPLRPYSYIWTDRSKALNSRRIARRRATCIAALIGVVALVAYFWEDGLLLLGWIAP
jgi:hypothetical protein